MSEAKDIIKTIDEIHERAWRATFSKEEVEEFDNLSEEDREDSSIYKLVQVYRAWWTKPKVEVKLNAKLIVYNLQKKLEREFDVYSGVLKKYVDKIKARGDLDDEDDDKGLMEAELMQTFVQRSKMIQFIQAELKALQL
jgi:hypothetical protein